jgi:hypothetical protein
MGVGGRDIDYPAGCPKPIDRRYPVTKHVAPANTETAFDHDSTLVVALELSGKSWEAGAVCLALRAGRVGVLSPVTWRVC